MHGHHHPRVLRERWWNPFVSLVSPYEDRVYEEKTLRRRIEPSIMVSQEVFENVDLQ